MWARFASSGCYTIAMSLHTYYTIYQFLTSYLWLLFVIRDMHDHKVICHTNAAVNYNEGRERIFIFVVEVPLAIIEALIGLHESILTNQSFIKK